MIIGLVKILKMIGAEESITMARELVESNKKRIPTFFIDYSEQIIGEKSRINA